MKVIPAILPKSHEELVSKLERISVFQNLIQIDFVDGVVGEEKTWMPHFDLPVKNFPEGDFQFDLMVEDWKTVALGLTKFMRVESIVFHIDSWQEEDIIYAAKWSKEEKIRIGFSITNDTGLDVLFDALRLAREFNGEVFVQVMGIRTIGVQGQLFDEECLIRIRRIKEIFGETFVQVDGAMRPETARKVKEAGADAVVVGSYLFGREELSLPLEELANI